MPQRVYRATQIASTKNRLGLLPISLSTVWRWAREDKNNFPKPFKLAAGTTVWDAGEVETFIAAQQKVSAP